MHAHDFVCLDSHNLSQYELFSHTISQMANLDELNRSWPFQIFDRVCQVVGEESLRYQCQPRCSPILSLHGKM